MLFNVCRDKSYITTIQLDTANIPKQLQVLTINYIIGQKFIYGHDTDTWVWFTITNPPSALT